MHKTVVKAQTNDTAKKGRFLFLKDKDFININPDGDDRLSDFSLDIMSGVNSPSLSPLELDPPVPNRAWTAMKMGKDIDALTEEEKRMLYYGKDNIL